MQDARAKATHLNTNALVVSHQKASQKSSNVEEKKKDDDDFGTNENETNTENTPRNNNNNNVGWCSEKNPDPNRPQTLVLKLLEPKSTVHQLLLTSHAYKIASKVHVSATTVSADAGKEETKKLGYVSFSENRESNFHARELKTIHLVAENCTELKLEFDQAYKNEKNVHGQIGIAKIQIIGMTPAQKMANMMNSKGSSEAVARTPEVKIINSNARSTIPSFVTHSNATTNTTFTSPPMFENMPCDAKTARRIQEIQTLKQKAVEVEDYDEAKRLRDVMNRLRKFGAAVAALEVKKMNAVRLEDYDTAKMLKAEIEKMDFDAFENSRNQNSNNNNNNNSTASSPILGMRVKNDENGNEIIVKSNAATADKSSDYNQDDAEKKNVAAAQPLSENNTRPDDASAIGLSNDEIPARASGRAKSPPTSPGVAGNSDGGPSFTPVSKFTLGGGSEMDENANTPTTNDDEETLQLSASEERDMEPILAIFNADVVAKLIKSGRWRTRDAALMEMNTVLLSATVTVEDANQFFVSVCRALAQKCLCDKIASAFIRACETLRNLCTFCCEKTNFDAKSSGSTHVAAVLSIEVVPFLLERLAEAHARARDAAKETLAHIATTVEKRHDSFIILEKIVESLKKKDGSSGGGGGGGGKGSSGSSSSSSSVVSSASSKPIAPRAMVKRLETLGLICSSLDNKSRGAHAIHAASRALAFCCKNLENNSGDVRKAAVESLALIGTYTGKSKVRDKLPKTLKSSIRDAVERALDEKVAHVEEGNEKDDDEYLIDLKTTTKNKNETSSRAGVAVEKEEQNREAMMKVFEAPRTSSPSFELRKTGASETAAMVSRSQQQQQEQQQQQQQQQHGGEEDKEAENEESDDDDVDYPSIEELQRELAALSVTKGTRHPDYARILVDIAAAKSDLEDYLGAVPLYEQALRIQENALGDDHPSSVQTLTDLAICRLDLGETHKGKPLLERALVLQKQQLGDDHADVVAIREVLMSL